MKESADDDSDGDYVREANIFQKAAIKADTLVDKIVMKDYRKDANYKAIDNNMRSLNEKIKEMDIDIARLESKEQYDKAESIRVQQQRLINQHDKLSLQEIELRSKVEDGFPKSHWRKQMESQRKLIEKLQSRLDKAQKRLEYFKRQSDKGEDDGGMIEFYEDIVKEREDNVKMAAGIYDAMQRKYDSAQEGTIKESVELTVFNESGDIIYTEKMTAEQYHKRNFKKKYNFVPDKDGSTRGTITVDGKKVRVDLNDKKCTSHHCNSMVPDSDIIQLGKEMFRAKGSKNRDFILQHELGHMNLHSLTRLNSDMTEEDFYDTLYAAAREVKRAYKENRNGVADKYSEDEVREILNMPDQDCAKILIAEIPHVRKKYDIIQKRKDGIIKNGKEDERIKARNAAKKYDNTDICAHANAQEFEADRYSANRTSDKVASKAISHLYDKDKKDAKKDRDKELMNNQSWMGRRINELKKANSKDRIEQKKKVQEMAHLDKHPLKDPSHIKRDSLKKELTEMSKNIKERGANISNYRDVKDKYDNLIRKDTKKAIERMDVDINSRLKALKDKDLKDNSALKKKK